MQTRQFSKFPQVDLKNVDFVAVLRRLFGDKLGYAFNDFGGFTRRRGPCPMCDGNTRFLVHEKNGQVLWACHYCGGGNAFQLIQKAFGYSKAQVFKAISDLHGVAYDVIKAPIDPAKLQAQRESEEAKIKVTRINLRNAWEIAQPIKDSNAAGRYLTNRVPGLDLSELSVNLRYHPKMTYRDSETNSDQGSYPALLAKVKDAACEPVTLHRTYLTYSGSKAPVEDPKKLMTGVKDLAGSAIRLTRNESRVLVLTEGIETGLAVLVAHEYRVNVWAMVFANNLGVADIPEGMFDRVVIYADNDKLDVRNNWHIGEHRAKQLQQKLIAKNIPCQIVLPPTEDKDFADMWIEQTPFELIGDANA